MGPGKIFIFYLAPYWPGTPPIGLGSLRIEFCRGRELRRARGDPFQARFLKKSRRRKNKKSSNFPENVIFRQNLEKSPDGDLDT